MTTRLTNTSTTSQTFNLTREIAPLRRVYDRTKHDGKTGETYREQSRVIIPDSVTLLHGESRGGFPDNVVTAPELATKIAKKLIRAEVEDAPRADAPKDGGKSDAPSAGDDKSKKDRRTA